MKRMVVDGDQFDATGRVGEPGVRAAMDIGAERHHGFARPPRMQRNRFRIADTIRSFLSQVDPATRYIESGNRDASGGEFGTVWSLDAYDAT